MEVLKIFAPAVCSRKSWNFGHLSLIAGEMGQLGPYVAHVFSPGGGLLLVDSAFCVHKGSIAFASGDLRDVTNFDGKTAELIRNHRFLGLRCMLQTLARQSGTLGEDWIAL